MKRFTDAHYEVIQDPRPKRRRYDRWDAAMLIGAAIFAIGTAVYQAVERHNASALPAQAAAPLER